MNILQENFLEQYSEELEILNFKLDRMHEAAFGPVADESMNESAVPELGLSLLEDVDAQPESDEPKILNEAAYELYAEALSDTVKKVWKAIVRMVRATFVSSGYRISGKEAHAIVNTLKEASEDGKVDTSNLKNMVQKGFYLIACVGTSVDGQALKSAYDNGNIVDFVSRNIGKVNLAKLPQDANFRVAIGTYESNVRNSMAITSAIFKALSTGGIKAVEKMASGVKEKGKAMLKKENAEDDGGMYDDDYFEGFEGFGDLDDIDAMIEAVEPFLEKMSDEQKADAAARKKEQAERNAAKEAAAKGQAKKDGKQIDDKTKASAKTNAANLQKSMDRPGAKLQKGEKGEFNWHQGMSRMRSALDAQAARAGDLDNPEAKKGYERARKSAAKLHASFTKHPPANQDEFNDRVQSVFGKKFNPGAGAAIGGAAAGLIALGIVGLVQKSKANSEYGTANDHIAMATIVFVNETQTNALAKIRLYGNGAVVQNFDIKGKENVAALQHDLEEIANKIGAECDNLSPGLQEALMAFGSNITTFFAGLTTRKSK